MLRGYVLRYLAAIVEGASPSAARARIPLAIRFVVERRARAHVIAVGFDTAHADDDRHVHRLAYLRAARRPAHTDEPDALIAAYAAGRDRGAEERAFGRVVLAAAVVALLCGAAVGGWRLWSELAHDPREPTLEEVIEAQAEEPEHPLRRVFAELIPAYTIALDRRTRGREPAAPDDVATRRASVLRALEVDSPALVEPMTGLLDAAERAADATVDDDQAAWLNRLVVFHDALREQDVPFYIDASIRRSWRSGEKRVWISTYTVRRRRRFDVGDHSITSLDIERLDTLNYDQSLLGYTRPEVRYALVRVDRVERFLIEQVLPSVYSADESVIVRGYENELGTGWVTDFESWAHQDLRSEHDALLAAALSGRSVGLAELAHAVVRRRNAIRSMGRALRDDGIRLREPRRYAYAIDRLDGLAARVNPGELGEVRSAERALHRGPVLHAYRTMAEAFGHSIAEHEVQHRLDYEAGRLQQVPDVLRRYTGETESEDRVNVRAERANAELSAYLSQIARRPTMARTSLIHVAGFAMDRNSWRMPEAYAAIALFEALARERGVAHEPLVASRRIQRAQIARIYGALRELDGEALSALAARTWTRLYGSELSPMELDHGSR